MSKKSLRDLIREPVTRKALYSAINGSMEIDDSDPKALRSTVITSAALLDVGMERLLKTRMRKLTSDDDGAFFGGLGMLSGFAAKIRLAYAINLIGPKTRRDLAALNDIRNLFAHSPHAVMADHPKLWSKIEPLHVFDWYRGNPGILHPSQSHRLTQELKNQLLVEALVNYALMLCHDRFRRVRLPRAEGGAPGLRTRHSLHL